MTLPITNSPDINLLSVTWIWDLSGTTPLITLQNNSEGANLNLVDYYFTATSPTGTFITEADFNTPNISGVWSSTNISAAWPRPFNQIEFSGPPYIGIVYAKDSIGNLYSITTQAIICRPNGNLPTSKNTYGIGNVLVQVKCNEARIYFQDNTNTSYKGLSGTIGSSLLRVNFPMDDTGTVPAPFQINYFATAMVPITYSGKGYQFLYTSIYDYDLGDDSHVRIKYLLSDTFGVFCNIYLLPLFCEYQKLITSIETGSCNDVQEANQKLMLINPKFSLVVMGMFQPLTGIDVPALIKEIETIGGFDCDCCNAATGIVPTGSSAFDGYVFSVVPLGGDVNGTFVQNGFNIQLQISDVKYIFKICDTSPANTTAFSVQPSVSSDGYTKTYCLFVDMPQLAEDILTTISESSSLVNLFNSIVQGNAGNFTLTVDGSCIFSSGSSCDYGFILSSIPASTTFAQLKYIFVVGSGGTTTTDKVPVNFSFNLTNLPALQSALNALGYGTFTVTDSGGGTVTITSVSNNNDISSMAYAITSTTLFAAMTKDCTGFIPLSANTVVQMIIDYICALDDSQVITSEAYEICYIDPTTKVQSTTIVSAGSTLTTFIQELLARGCDTINYIISLSATNCAAVKALFPSSVVAMQPDDVFLATKAGLCASVNPIEAFLTMLTYGYYNADVVQAFCNIVSLCRGDLICTQYSNFSVSTNTFDEDCPTVINFSLSGNTPLTVNSVTFANAPTIAQTVFVEYKLIFDSVWTAGGSSLTDTGSTLGTLLTPVALSATVAGQFYNIRVYNGCQSPPQYAEPSAAYEAGTTP